MKLLDKNKPVLFVSFFLICLFALLISCRKSEHRKCFKPLGKTVAQFRDAAPFDTIYLHNHINLIITQDSIHKILIEAPENLIHFVKTEISKNTLTIQNENKCNFLRSYKYEINVYVSVVKLEHIYFTGSGKITSTNTIKSTKFTTNFWGASGSMELSLEAKTTRCNIHTGTGDVTLNGTSDSTYFYSAGNGFMHLENFICKISNVQNKGTGDVYVNVQKEISVVLVSTGSIFCKGNPAIIYSEITGSGNFVKI